MLYTLKVHNTEYQLPLKKVEGKKRNKANFENKTKVCGRMCLGYVQIPCHFI